MKKTMKKVFGWTLISLISIMLGSLLLADLIVAMCDDAFFLQPIAAALMIPVMWINFHWWEAIKGLIKRKLGK